MALITFADYTAVPGGAVSGAAAVAKAAFIAATDNRTNDGFGEQALGDHATLSVLGGAGTMVFDYEWPVPEERIPGEVRNVSTDPPIEGRFDTTGDGPARWALSTTSVSIALSPARSAFGVYVTDFGDFLAGLEVQVVRSDDNVTTIDLFAVLPSGIPASGALLFFGFLDEEATYKEVRFNVTQASENPGEWDYLGYDDVVVGDGGAAPPPPPPPPSEALSVTRGWGATRNVVTVRMIPSPAPPPPA